MEPSETAVSARTMPDEQLAHMARDLVLMMMSCASTDTISPVDWWPRAKSALLAACSRARTWGELVTTMADKLEVDVLRVEVAKVISSLRLTPADVRAFVRVARAEGVYIVAEAAAQRAEDRAQRESAK